MSIHDYDGHLNAEAFQAYLDGALPDTEAGPFQEHLEGCVRCRAELEGWTLLFEELEELDVLEPSPAFAEAVMTGVEREDPDRLPLAARVRGWLPVPRRRKVRHPEGPDLQDWIEGLLPGRAAARIENHLEGCPVCAREAERWTTLIGHLEGLPRLSPAAGFAERVMAEVRVPVPTLVAEPGRGWIREHGSAWLGALGARTRERWAMVSGVALTPVTVVGVILYTVFSHPLLTPGTLAAFLWLKAQALLASASETAAGAVATSVSTVRAHGMVEAAFTSPELALGGALLLAAGMLSAVWILYRNLIATPTVDGRYAIVSR